MKFINREHENFYNSHMAIASRNDDFAALVYTLGIDDLCRRHFNDLYNAEEHCIHPDGLKAGWQTGASVRITRLAFNLFTWEIPEEEDPQDYTVKSLFSSLDDEHREGALLAIDYFA